MKKLKYLIFFSVPLFTLWFCTSSSCLKEKERASNPGTEELKTGTTHVAVLELFTSQGCSSCPSADRLLERLSAKENVIALSFHVDYWNRLGWKDPYSSHEFTQRQYKYASALHSSVYTPQLVVNGADEMVGSDAKKIERTLQKAWSQNDNTDISIGNVIVENGKATIIYTINGTTNSTMLNIALVEKKTVTAIKAGENGGITLNGTNVVRNFKIIDNPAEGKNSCTIDIPAGIDPNNMSVVLYLQQNDNKISAADQARIAM